MFVWSVWVTGHSRPHRLGPTPSTAHLKGFKGQIIDVDEAPPQELIDDVRHDIRHPHIPVSHLHQPPHDRTLTHKDLETLISEACEKSCSFNRPPTHLQGFKGQVVDVDEASPQQLVRHPHIPVPYFQREQPLAAGQLGPLQVELLAPVGVQGPVEKQGKKQKSMWCILQRKLASQDCTRCCCCHKSQLGGLHGG